MKRIAIVGGGISGLSAAYYLSKSGYDCTLIEASSRLGGVIRTERVEGCVVEAGPDSFIAQKPWAMELIRELGIEDQVIGSQDHLRQTYVLRNGRLVPLPDGIQFLIPTKIAPLVTTRLLSLQAKARMGLECFRRPGGESKDRSVADFVIDHYGREVNEYLAQPMLAGVYGGAPEQLSINAVMPRMVELERRYGSVTRGVLTERRMAASRNKERAAASDSETGGRNGAAPRSLFLSLKGGMQQLVDELAGRLEGKVRSVTATVEHVERDAAGFRVRADGDDLGADQVVLATPAYQAGELVRGLDASLADLLEAIPYNSSVTVALLYARPEFDHPLNGFGFIVPRAEGRPLTACTWVNTKFPHRAADGRALLRAFLGGSQAEQSLDDSDEQITRLAHQELSGLMAYRAEPAAARVQRWRRAMAQYEVGHSRRQQDIDERMRRLPGLWLTGNAYSGIGIPDCIRRSRVVADDIVQRSVSRGAA